MKPFDLEAAKRGDPLVTDGEAKCTFIGIDSNGRIVVEYIHGGGVDVYSYCDLFMAPKKLTVWVNFYPSGDAYHYGTEEAADTMIRHARRIGGKAYPVEVEE